MSKDEQQILVVPRSKLFSNEVFQGLSTVGNYQDRILTNYEYMRRGDAEINPEFKQPIGYILIVNKQQKTVYAYQRCNQNAGESRLHDKWSWGIGGHVEQHDGDINPVLDSAHRELEEEVGITGDLKVIGYINDDSNEVGKVHFGVLCVCETDKDEFSTIDPEIAQGRFHTLDELKSLIKTADVETWSQIALQAVEEFFEKE